MKDIEVNWNAVANEAATAFGKAVGGEIGAAVGKALGQLIFGAANGEDEFQSEIRQSLALINGKLDQILSWINGFPELLQQLLTKERLLELAERGDVQSRRIAGELATFSGYKKPKWEQAKALESVGLAAIDTAEELMGVKGATPDSYITAMYIYTIGAAAVIRAGNIDKAFLRGLGIRAGTTAITHVGAMLSPSPTGKSLPDVAERFAHDGPIAQDFLDSITNKSREFLLSWQKLPDGENLIAENGCWFGIPQSGGLLGDTLYNVSTIPNFDAATDLPKLRFKVCPYWTPLNGPASIDHYNVTIDRINTARVLLSTYQTYYPGLVQAVASIESFRTFLLSLSKLAPKKELPTSPTTIAPGEHLAEMLRKTKH